MNISMITSVPIVPPWDQGDKNLGYALTRALPQHQFQVLTARREPTPPGANLLVDPIFHRRDPTLLGKTSVYLKLLAKSLAARPGKNTWPLPDLYHLIYQPFTVSSWLNRGLPEFHRRPTLHTVPATSPSHRLRRDLIFADRVVTLSRHGQKRLQGLGLRDVVYIAPGISLEPWQALARRTDEGKAKFGLEGHPVVLFPGHYSSGQGVDVLFRALPELVAEVPGVRLIFACRLRSSGDRGREEALKKALRERNLSEHVIFYNTVNDMQALIGASDLVVLPLATMHHKVDIPTTLLEAMAAAKPIVISDLAPMEELVSVPGHRVGLAVRPGDADALAHAMELLLCNPDLARMMGRNGQELVRCCFDIQNTARRYEEEYLDLAG
jgi:glycosyltransferase involved in cell wall biosynthesis